MRHDAAAKYAHAQHPTTPWRAMDAKSLKRLLPRDKDDAQAAERLVALGFATIEPVLPQMLDWLKTPGSPVERVMRDFFVRLGVRAAPTVQKALASRNDALKYFVVMNVIAEWPAEAIVPLKARLEALATGWDPYGTDLPALRLLAEHGLAERAWLAQWAEFKANRLRAMLAQAQSITDLLAR